MSTSYVNAAGLRLRVSRTGVGRPLLLITGIGANLDMWAPLERLVTDRELIAFDAPGVGLSQRPRAPLRMPQLARIVRELMDALALERADVLGYSFGGALAQEFARRAPDRVRRLVLCAAGPGLGGVPPRPMAALMLATPARYYHPSARVSVPVSRAGATRATRPSRPSRRRAPGRPTDLLATYLLRGAAGRAAWLNRVQVDEPRRRGRGSKRAVLNARMMRPGARRSPSVSGRRPLSCREPRAPSEDFGVHERANGLTPTQRNLGPVYDIALGSERVGLMMRNMER